MRSRDSAGRREVAGLTMRVIVLADLEDMRGGAQKVAAQSAQALADAGVDTVLITSTGRGEIVEGRLTRTGLGLPDVWDLPMHKGAMAGVWNKRAALMLGQALERFADGDVVVHLHQWTRAFSPSAFQALAQSGLPFAVTLHDYSLFCPNGLYYRFDVHKPCALEPLSVSCLAASCDPRSMLHKIVRVARTFRTRQAINAGGFDVVHVSQRGAETTRGALPEGVREHVIANPVSIARADAARIRPDAAFAYIGRLTVEKGAVLAAQAARVAQVPVVFIGEGPAEGAILEANKDARLLGRKSAEELSAMLASGALRAVLAPSLWNETGPLTVYEAQAHGVPVIASRRAGAGDQIADGVTGLSVEPECEAFAQAMRSLADQDRAAQMGAAGHARYWADPPSPQAHARRLIELYKAMLQRKDQAGGGS